MTQTIALFVDAYRELNSKRLFWITLVLSGLVVAAFALVGINEQGLRIIVWDIPVREFNSTIMSQQAFYKLLFVNLGIGFWLAWIATVLALVTTAGIIPDFVSAGSIDLMLCKPLGRLRLFLTKYATGLLFVALQVAVFCAASFFVLGFKGDTWEPKIFLAIPIVTVFFSYLYCICALLGLITRSTIASLMLTLLAWFFMFAIGATENFLLLGRKATDHEVAMLDRRITADEAVIEKLRARGAEIDFDAASATYRERIDRNSTDRERTTRIGGNLGIAHDISLMVKTALPKTSETVGLLERALIDLSEIRIGDEENGISVNFNDADAQPRARTNETLLARWRKREIGREMQELRSRSVWWVVGTSLLFEAFVLAIASWMFCRRDFSDAEQAAQLGAVS